MVSAVRSMIDYNIRQRKINVLFPEMSQYFLGSLGRQIVGGFFYKIFYIGKALKSLKIP